MTAGSHRKPPCLANLLRAPPAPQCVALRRTRRRNDERRYRAHSGFPGDDAARLSALQLLESLLHRREPAVGVALRGPVFFARHLFLFLAVSVRRALRTHDPVRDMRRVHPEIRHQDTRNVVAARGGRGVEQVRADCGEHTGGGVSGSAGAAPAERGRQPQPATSRDGA